MNPSEGDAVTYTAKCGITTGIVLKKAGMRLRVSNQTNGVWIETKDVKSIVSKVPPIYFVMLTSLTHLSKLCIYTN